MKSTSPASRFESSAARSPGRSTAGPLVARNWAPSSTATIRASEVLPRPGGPWKEHVIEGLAPLASGAHEDVQVLAQPRLPDHLLEVLRPERLLGASILGLSRQGELTPLHPISSAHRARPTAS
jgi:hypothetical protein